MKTVWTYKTALCKILVRLKNPDKNVWTLKLVSEYLLLAHQNLEKYIKEYEQMP